MTHGPDLLGAALLLVLLMVAGPVLLISAGLLIGWVRVKLDRRKARKK